jgi:ElaB/YqjD/DUF883 family membrane-anchored ribosome-binding protein
MSTETTTPMGGNSSPGTERIQDAAGDLMDQAGRTAEAQASRTMTQAGDTLEHVAQAVRDAGSGLRADSPQLASVADTIAGQVERTGSYLREHEAREAIEAATDFARRQPVLVIGGALLAGLALGRFLRSAADAQSYGGYGSNGSRLRSGTYAGMSSAYGASDYDAYASSAYDRYPSERAMPSSTVFENRTSELQGTSASAAGAGSSPSSSTRKRSSSSGDGSSSRRSSSSGSATSSGTSTTSSRKSSGSSSESSRSGGS